MLEQPGVEFIGEINDRAKTEFLGEARALLFPIDWPEPFGLSMIEAMACGTPVLAFRHGSVPEVIDQGVTGFMVDLMEEAVRTLPRVLALDRHAVRRQFEKRFSATRMARDYVALYRSLLKHPIRSSETNGLEISIETSLASSGPVTVSIRAPTNRQRGTNYEFYHSVRGTTLASSPLPDLFPVPIARPLYREAINAARWPAMAIPTRHRSATVEGISSGCA